MGADGVHEEATATGEGAKAAAERAGDVRPSRAEEVTEFYDVSFEGWPEAAFGHGGVREAGVDAADIETDKTEPGGGSAPVREVGDDLPGGTGSPEEGRSSGTIEDEDDDRSGRGNGLSDGNWQ